MEYQEYKLENTVGKLIKELRANNYLIMGYSELFPLLSFEIGKESKIPGRYNPFGRIDVGERTVGKIGSFEIRLSILGGDDFIKDKKKVLSIAKKYLEKRPQHHKRKHKTCCDNYEITELTRKSDGKTINKYERKGHDWHRSPQ